MDNYFDNMSNTMFVQSLHAALFTTDTNSSTSFQHVKHMVFENFYQHQMYGSECIPIISIWVGFINM